MSITSYLAVAALLADLLSAIRGVLGERLLGVYLYGSLVSGDFDPEISDVDLLAVIASDLETQEATALQQMHEAFVRRNPRWEQRIEVQYFSADGLRSFRTQSRKMGNISPGEPFHIIDAGVEWLLNWYFVCEKDVVLYGPSSHQYIGPISKAEYVRAVRDQAQQLAGQVGETKHSWHGQSYTILTLCRAWYGTVFFEQPSKKQAAEWVAQQAPEWTALIEDALRWRKHWTPEHGTPEAVYPGTERFVQMVLERLAGQ